MCLNIFIIILTGQLLGMIVLEGMAHTTKTVI